jgi:hypothetical protein
VAMEHKAVDVHLRVEKRDGRSNPHWLSAAVTSPNQVPISLNAAAFQTPVLVLDFESGQGAHARGAGTVAVIQV